MAQTGPRERELLLYVSDSATKHIARLLRLRRVLYEYLEFCSVSNMLLIHTAQLCAVCILHDVLYNIRATVNWGVGTRRVALSCRVRARGFDLLDLCERRGARRLVEADARVCNSPGIYCGGTRRSIKWDNCFDYCWK